MNQNILSLVALNNLLREYNIDTTNWKHDRGNKTIEELYIEIGEGESILEIIEGKLVRLLQVSSMEVKFKLGDKYFQLVEDKQIFLSGVERRRELTTITEKIKKNETPLQAGYRGLEEEINLKLEKDLTFIGETFCEKISPSYPNLITRYQFYNFQIVLGEEDIKKVRFFEYIEEEKLLNLFTLKLIIS